MARKSKYEQIIPPNIEKIKEWLSQGVPERDVAKNLGVGYTTWRRWKSEKVEFRAIMDNERRPKLEELENTMFKLATGYSYTVDRHVKVRDPGGGEHVEHFVDTVVVDPNFNALRFLLTNWSEKYANDPALLRQRKEEFEHKKKMDEENSW